jgi:two-component system alkaline phosphatase synthesis response regulator PhoP
MEKGQGKATSRSLRLNERSAWGLSLETPHVQDRPRPPPDCGAQSGEPGWAPPRNMKTILVVDDEPKIVQIARDYLEHAGFAVLTARDGKGAVATFRASKPDLVVLDLGLPELDGLDVTRALRKDSSVPIIILTARGEETDKLVGLELGADDYITKPFSPKELVARVRAVLRRLDTASANAGAETIRAGDLTLDVPRMRVTVGERAVEVTPTEFQLLATLGRQPGRIFTRAQLLDAVRGVAFESYERAIDAHIKNIRRKIEPDPHLPRYVLTVYGVGYKFADK